MIEDEFDVVVASIHRVGTWYFLRQSRCTLTWVSMSGACTLHLPKMASFVEIITSVTNYSVWSHYSSSGYPVNDVITQSAYALRQHEPLERLKN